MPNLSIITINLNNLAGLQKTMQSVFEQTYTDYEYIVIDGSSNDGSREYIEQYVDKLAYWVSKKDGGIYNAMNKGIVKSKGEYLLFLNSGDYLNNSNVLFELHNRGNGQDIIYGDIFWESNGQYREGVFPSYLSWRYFRKQSLPHQATIIRRCLFEKYGLYDESLQIVSDWKHFLLMIFKYNCSYQHVALTVTVCNRDGISCDPDIQSIINSERESTLRDFFYYIEKEFAIYESRLNVLEQEYAILQKFRKSFTFRLQNKFFDLFIKK